MKKRKCIGEVLVVVRCIGDGRCIDDGERKGGKRVRSIGNGEVYW